MHPTDQLSTDVLTEIFTLTCRTDFSKDVVGNISPLDLGAVCSSWRNLVWSTPSLWRYIYVKVSPDRYKAQAALLEDWLGRTGSGPLHVVFRVADEGAEEDKVVRSFDHWSFHNNRCSQIVLEPLLRESSRWRTLELDIVTFEICEIMCNIQGQFALLRQLRIRLLSDSASARSDKFQRQFCFYGRTPQLTHLSVENFSYCAFDLEKLGPEPQVHLASLSLNRCYDALEWLQIYAKTVRHLSFKASSYWHGSHQTQPQRILQLRSLQSLYIMPNSEVAKTLSKSSSAPMLQNLALPLPTSNAPNLEYINTLLSGRRIQVLRLQLPLSYDPDLSNGGTENRVAGLITALQSHCDTLTELALEVGHLGGGNGYFVDRFHEALRNDLQAFPRLASYDFRVLRASPHGSRDWLWTRMDPVRQVIKSWCDDRRAGMQSGEQLTLRVSLPDIECDRTKQVLEQEIRDGLQVNFTDPFQGYSRSSVDWHLQD